MKKIFISEALEKAYPISNDDDEKITYILRNCINKNTHIIEDVWVYNWYVIGKDLVIIDNEVDD